MLATEPIAAALIYGSVAALLASLGALPYAWGRPSHSLVGLAYALAGGVMVGAGYVLGVAGLDRQVLSSAAGALAGIAFPLWTLRFTAVREHTAESEGTDDAAGFRFLLQSTLHSTAEGVAIGVGLAVSPALGIFLALSLGLHNIAEATGLTEYLRRWGMSVGQSAALAVATNLSQPLAAAATVVLLGAFPGLLPPALGFAAGALLVLVLAELAPDAYLRAGRRVVALLLSTAAALVLLLEDLLL